MRRRATMLFGAGVALVVALVLAKGVGLHRYSPERSEAYAWGAFHVHSDLSDGRAPLAEIADEARAAGVDFVLLSDHGSPHREAAVLDETIDGVRFVGGSEVGLPEGHLIVSGADFVPDYDLPPYPPDAVDEIETWGGLSVVTYPEDPVQRWSYWDADLRPDGLEIINITSFFRQSSAAQKLDWLLFSLFTPYYYIEALEAPSYALSRWDELAARGPVWGFYAANAHGGFPLSEDLWVGLPSYRTGLSFVGVGIDAERVSDPESAIREGAFFSVVRAAGEPQRFDFARDGDAIVARVETRGLATRLLLKRNGVQIAESREPELRAPALAGVYRVEVYLEGHLLLAPDVPWILGNPITVSGVSPAHPEPGDAPSCDLDRSLGLDALVVEKDEESEAELKRRGNGIDLRYHLSQTTAERVDRWVALAYRQRLDLSAFRGVWIEASAPTPMRYRLELRSGERSYYASFKVEPNGLPVTVTWDRFYRIGAAREAPPLGDIDSLFVSVSTGTSRTGFSSALVLSTLGFCR